MAQRFSLLCFLSNDEQTYVSSVQAELHCRIYGRRPRLEMLPAELRDMIFRQCILDDHANPFVQSNPIRRFDVDRTVAFYITLLVASIVSITSLVVLVVLLVCPGEQSILLWRWCASLALLALYTILQASVALPLRWRQNASAPRPRTSIWQEFLAASVLMEDLLLPYDLSMDQRAAQVCQKVPRQCYDLPIFFLNRGLRDDALGTAKRIGFRQPSDRPRDLIARGLSPGRSSFNMAYGCKAANRRKSDYCNSCKQHPAYKKNKRPPNVRYTARNSIHQGLSSMLFWCLTRKGQRVSQTYYGSAGGASSVHRTTVHIDGSEMRLRLA